MITAPGTAGYLLFLIGYGFEQFKQLDANAGLALFAQIQFVDQFFITIRFCLAQIIEQAPAHRHHLEEAAARRMVFGMALEVFGQLPDPAGQKCDLHVRAASVFIVELELLHVHRVTAFCHKRAGSVGEEWALASGSLPLLART